MTAESSAVRKAATARRPVAGRRRGGGIRGREAVAGWLFTAPVIVLVVLFLVVPMLMAAWVSVSDWNGQGNPFSSGVRFVGARNYSALLGQGGLAQQDLMTSLRNNFYYVLLVVPLQTALALFLAMALNRRRLAGRGFFRTAFYFPSVTSSVAISIVFLFMFSGGGVVNALLAKVGVAGPNWFANPDGLIHIVLDKLGVHSAPAALANHGFLGQSWWDWFAGPSVAMVALIVLAVWTTSGTFMLIFLAALQNIPAEVEEAAVIDGTTAWQRLRLVTLPMLRPALFLVLTLGLIGTWQIFDQVYIMSQGNPAKTTLTPAYLSYTTSFNDQQWGQGAAIAFILFAIIVVLTIFQRFALRERDGGR
jgi:multiple sugar transport system permease protein